MQAKVKDNFYKPLKPWRLAAQAGGNGTPQQLCTRLVGAVFAQSPFFLIVICPTDCPLVWFLRVLVDP